MFTEEKRRGEKKGVKSEEARGEMEKMGEEERREAK